jgi:glycolate oxidase FAD binding subunit
MTSAHANIAAAQSTAAKLVHIFETLLGGSRVRTPQDHEVSVLGAVLEPESVEEIREIVRKCESDSLSLAPLGAGRTLSQIRSKPVMLGLSLARMRQVVAYEPEDMTVVAQAGLSLGELNRLIGQRRQRLPVDPPGPDLTTLGAMVGAAKAGPLRLSEGRVRDLLIGIEFVSHDGRVARGGGRVVKNVAGYDLMKVMTGSFGTLGIITETTFKVRPLPELEEVALAPFADAERAFAAARALHDTLPLFHLEVLSPAFAQEFGYPQSWLTLAAFGGNQVEVDYQRSVIEGQLREKLTIMDGPGAGEISARVRDLGMTSAAMAAELAVLPGELGGCLASCRAEYIAYAGCGVARIFAPAADNAGEALRIVEDWRQAARKARGHVRLTALAPELRGAGLAFFDQVNAGAMKLMTRLKRSFDPAGIFNPGCFVGGL